MDSNSIKYSDDKRTNKHLIHVQTLFVKYMPRIKAFVYSLMPDISQVDDITQDIFLTVTAKAADFQEGTNFLAWVFAIARFRVLKSMNAMDKAFLPLSEEVLDALAADCHEPEADQDRRLELLEFCMEKLAPQARRMIKLRYHGALKASAIAERLDLSVNGVSVLLSRSRTLLRDCVERHMRLEQTGFRSSGYKG
jgi:RNA polymerase sigma-70 factor, ECF subfamily